MKRIIVLLTAILFAGSASAQVSFETFDPAFSVDAGIGLGTTLQSIHTDGLLNGYNNSLNGSASSPHYQSSVGECGSLAAGFFYRRDNHIGFGIGLDYLKSNGTIDVNTFHVEYQATDNFGRTYRQEITNASEIKEKIASTSMNIPIVLKYKGSFSYHLGFVVDAGIFYEMSFANAASMNGSYNWEAVYKFVNGNAVYDNSPVPNATNDWLITKAEYTKTDGANVNAVFNQLKSEGYDVGLNQGVKSFSGSNKAYKSGAIGYTIRPALAYRIGKDKFLNFGVYYNMVNVNNGKANSAYQMIGANGVETSLLNAITKSSIIDLGITIGFRMYLYRNDFKNLAFRTDS